MYYHVRIRGTGGHVASFRGDEFVSKSALGIKFKHGEDSTSFYPWDNVVWVKTSRFRDHTKLRQ